MTLIKSSLDSISNYWFSLHYIPKGILKILECTRRKFFWGDLKHGDDGKRKLHSLRYEAICASKENGGLSLVNLELKILILLSKWWWKFHEHKEKFWMQFILHKYGSEFLYNDVSSTNNMSPMFQNILKCREIEGLKQWVNTKKFRWKIGNGSSINFWKDCWHNDSPLRNVFPRLFNLALDKDMKLCIMKDLWSNSSQWI